MTCDRDTPYWIMAWTLRTGGALGILAALVVAPAPALAQSKQPDFKQLKKREARPAKTSRPHRTACPEYGAGFYRLEGSDTCMRIGGSIGVTVGSGSSITNLPLR